MLDRAGTRSVVGSDPRPGVVAACAAARRWLPRRWSARLRIAALLPAATVVCPGRHSRSRTTLRETCEPHAADHLRVRSTARRVFAVRRRSGSQPDAGTGCAASVSLLGYVEPGPSRAREAVADHRLAQGSASYSARRS